MRATKANVGLVCLGLVVLLIVVAALSLSVGTASISLGQVWAWLRGELADQTAALILTNFRLPRLLLAALAGAALSQSGATFQGLLRNPLAEPFILGVSGGAAAGAVLSLILGLAGIWGTALMAFGGSLGTVILVLAIARRRGRMETSTLILSGVMVNAFFTAVIMFIISTTTDQKLHAIMFWLYGDLSAATLDQAWLLVPAVVCVWVEQLLSPWRSRVRTWPFTTTIPLVRLRLSLRRLLPMGARQRLSRRTCTTCQKLLRSSSKHVSALGMLISW